ncbi:MAG: iron-sulfur cluster repair di-iron protein, partial [Deltaproteobacteria bacterium]|nr:iron-sulfur cluster repair di-iron protein [Deltaproteobacteria bacterium]
MSTANVDKPVGQLVRERPAAARVFERLGIDYCCQGKRTLAEACQQGGLDLDAVDSALEGEESVPAEFDWLQLNLNELADHIVATHHTWLRSELPRLTELFEKVIRAHGERHAEVVQAAAIYARLREELAAHMGKEEQVLFPILHRLARGERGAVLCGSLARPIHVMEHEHSEVGQALAELRHLTAGFAPPADACTTFCVLYAGLAALEQDLHLHIHKENNVLFPRAQALERRARERVAAQEIRR